MGGLARQHVSNGATIARLRQAMVDATLMAMRQGAVIAMLVQTVHTLRAELEVSENMYPPHTCLVFVGGGQQHRAGAGAGAGRPRVYTDFLFQSVSCCVRLMQWCFLFSTAPTTARSVHFVPFFAGLALSVSLSPAVGCRRTRGSSSSCASGRAKSARRKPCACRDT